MPYEKHWEKGGVVTRYWGFIDGGELADSCESIAADPRFDDLRFVIQDFATIDGHDIDAASIERIAVCRIGSMASNPNIRVLMVTVDEGVAAVKSQLESPRYGETFETRVFASVTLARQWLKEQPAVQKTAARFGR